MVTVQNVTPWFHCIISQSIHSGVCRALNCLNGPLTVLCTSDSASGEINGQAFVLQLMIYLNIMNLICRSIKHILKQFY